MTYRTQFLENILSMKTALIKEVESHYAGEPVFAAGSGESAPDSSDGLALTEKVT